MAYLPPSPLSSRLRPAPEQSLTRGITAGRELFSFRGSFSFKKSASYFPGTLLLLPSRKKLHARVLLQSRTSVSPNSISRIRSPSRNFVPSLPLVSVSPSPSLRGSLVLSSRHLPAGCFPPPPGDSPNFSKPRRERHRAGIERI